MWIEQFGWNLISDEGLFLDFFFFSSSGFVLNIFCLSEAGCNKESFAFLIILELEEGLLLVLLHFS